MKRKNKLVLTALCALLFGTGVGTAIGYGVFHKDTPKEEEKVKPDDVVKDDSVPELNSDSTAPKEAFRALGGVRKAVANVSDPENYVANLYSFRTAKPSTYGVGANNNLSIKKADLATDGTLILKFTDTPISSNYTNRQFTIQETYYTEDEDGTYDNRDISSIGLLTYTYSTDEDGSDYWEYRSCNSGTIGQFAGSRDGSDFYVIVNMNDFQAGSARDTVYLGSKNWTSVEIMHSRKLSYPSSLNDGQTKDLYINCNSGYTSDTIIGSISAKDLFGVDCEVKIIEGKESFDANKIGVYTLKLQATDSYGQTATATLIVHIVDSEKPAISQKKALTFTADKGQKLTYAALADYISITDNGTAHGSTFSYDYTYDGKAIDSSWSKTFTASDYGRHTLVAHAKDATGNENRVSFTVTVNDGTAPVLTRRDGQAVSSKITIGVSKTFNMDLSDIIQMFKAVDNVDGDVSGSIKGVSDADVNFFSKNHKVGSYTINIQVSDKDHNTTTQSLPIVINADIPPVFIISDTLVYTDTANPLDVASLNNIVAKAILAPKKVASLNVDASDYVGNEDVPGTYNITYTYTEADSANSRVKSANRGDAEVQTGSFDLVVTEADPNGGKEDKDKGFFAKIGDFFQKLKNWFRGVFTHFDFHCFITDDAYDAKYPKKVEEVK